MFSGSVVQSCKGELPRLLPMLLANNEYSNTYSIHLIKGGVNRSGYGSSRPCRPQYRWRTAQFGSACAAQIHIRPRLKLGAERIL